MNAVFSFLSYLVAVDDDNALFNFRRQLTRLVLEVVERGAARQSVAQVGRGCLIRGRGLDGARAADWRGTAQFASAAVKHFHETMSKSKVGMLSIFNR